MATDCRQCLKEPDFSSHNKGHLYKMHSHRWWDAGVQQRLWRPRAKWECSDYSCFYCVCGYPLYRCL